MLTHTEDQYCYATIYNQDCALYGFEHHNLTNEQYYAIFNDKVDVVEAIGITRQHCVIIGCMAKETLKTFDEISSDEKLELIKDTKERYLSYIFLW